MPDIPNCPKCDCEYCYESGALMICPDCNHEWNPSEAVTAPTEEGLVVLDTNGTPLADGDTVSIVKGLKVKGSNDLKAGTKVKNIRLCEGDHNIDCKIPGYGGMKLKSEFVKKA